VDGIKVAEAVARDVLGLEAEGSGAKSGPGCGY
jgi:hypothetical protein